MSGLMDGEDNESKGNVELFTEWLQKPSVLETPAERIVWPEMSEKRVKVNVRRTANTEDAGR